MTAPDRELAALESAGPADAPAVAALHAAVADVLTRRFGTGHWSSSPTERGVLQAMRTGRVLVARVDGRIAATLTLTTRKPWAIDIAYFTACARPLYLTSMAVDPALQRRGYGRSCIEQAIAIARAWPADAIRLDAYDAEAGAGEFYRRCGFHETGRVVYRRVPLIYFELFV